MFEVNRKKMSTAQVLAIFCSMGGGMTFNCVGGTQVIYVQYTYVVQQCISAIHTSSHHIRRCYRCIQGGALEGRREGGRVGGKEE